jgi:hypothetical protein
LNTVNHSVFTSDYVHSKQEPWFQISDDAQFRIDSGANELFVLVLTW